MELTTKQRREMREFQTIFKNPKYARAAWAQTVYDRYSRPAMEPFPVTIDDKGTLSKESQIEMMVYKRLLKEFEERGLSRLPTEGEFMEACQSYYARHHSASYIARRDSMGAKPVDESKQTHEFNNPYESMSDEELIVVQEALEKHRQKKLEMKADEENRLDYEGNE